jgi:hypothetical protein
LYYPHPPQNTNCELIEQLTKPTDQVKYYEDLDGNGYSDRILFSQYLNKITVATILFNPSSRSKECSLKGQFAFSDNDNLLSAILIRMAKKSSMSSPASTIRCLDQTPVCFTRKMRLGAVVNGCAGERGNRWACGQVDGR